MVFYQQKHIHKDHNTQQSTLTVLSALNLKKTEYRNQTGDFGRVCIRTSRSRFCINYYTDTFTHTISPSNKIIVILFEEVRMRNGINGIKANYTCFITY